MHSIKHNCVAPIFVSWHPPLVLITLHCLCVYVWKIQFKYIIFF